MNAAIIDTIVETVLYEGYVLYPYRPSSVKNHQRWTFGGIYSKAYSEAIGSSDPWMMQAQCLIAGSDDPRVGITVRFLQPTLRTTLPEGETWQEAVERRIDIGTVRLTDVLDNPRVHPFEFPSQQTAESRNDADGSILREQRALTGAITVLTERKADELFQATVRIENLTRPGATGTDRDAASLESFASTHMILTTEGAEFVSLTDPPATLTAFAQECENVGCWPVLVGTQGERDTILACPIILSDYPEVAAESPGNLFDGTEIDEILSLRIMTLTAEEKRQAAANDERVRAMLARTDALARDQLLSLHGTFRGLSPVQAEQRHA